MILLVNSSSQLLQNCLKQPDSSRMKKIVIVNCNVLKKVFIQIHTGTKLNVADKN